MSRSAKHAVPLVVSRRCESAVRNPQSLVMASPALRAAVLRLALSVVVLDAIAITIYYLAAIPLRPPSVRYPFFGAWLVLTLAVVLSGLHRIRVARARRM
jgi:hypothetical protein